MQIYFWPVAAKIFSVSATNYIRTCARFENVNMHLNDQTIAHLLQPSLFDSGHSNESKRLPFPNHLVHPCQFCLALPLHNRRLRHFTSSSTWEPVARGARIEAGTLCMKSMWSTTKLHSALQCTRQGTMARRSLSRVIYKLYNLWHYADDLLDNCYSRPRVGGRTKVFNGLCVNNFTLCD